METGMSLKLSHKFILGITLLSVLSLAVAFVIVNTLVRNIIYDNVMESYYRERVIQSQQLDTWFYAGNSIVENLSETLPHIDRGQILDIVVHFEHQYDFIESVWVAMADGGFYDSGLWVPPAGFVSQERPWWLTAAEAQGNTAITLPYVAAHTGGLVATVVRHLPNLYGQEAVIAMNIELDHLVYMINTFENQAGGHLLLMGSQGEIIIHPDALYLPSTDGLQNILDIPGYGQVFSRILAGEAVVQYANQHGVESYFIGSMLYAPGWFLVEVIPTIITGTPVWQVLWAIMLTILLSVSIVSVFTYFFLSRGLLKPINDLKASAIEVAKGNLTSNLMTNLVTNRNDEIGKVSNAFAEIVKSQSIMVENFRDADYAYKHGNILYQLHDSRMEGVYAELFNQVNDITTEIILTMDYLSEPIIYVGEDLKVLYANNVMKEYTGIKGNRIIGMHINDVVRSDIAGHPSTVAALTQGKRQPSEKLRLQLDSVQLLDMEYSCVPFKYDGQVVCLLIMLTNITQIMDIQRNAEKRTNYRNLRTEKLTDTIVTAFEKGNLAMSVTKSGFDEDTKDIAEQQDKVEMIVQRATGVIKSYVDELTTVLRDIAGNNFDVSINREYIGDFGSIRDSIGMITKSVSSLISEIQAATFQVEVGAGQISQSTQGLMASFEEQAAAMSGLRQAVEVLTEKTQKNAENARSASGISERVQEAANAGTKHMDDMSTVMEEIKQSSAEIAKVASVIESIAFQTNLLALNASVEAARAGEHGKGFAVVAQEVRSLAGRSSEAAKNTSEMIAKSIGRVDEGVVKSGQTSDALRKIAEMTNGVVDVVANIAYESNEQAEEINKIKHSMESIYRGTSENVGVVESNTSVSDELSKQATMLMSLVERFRISKR
ncbi:MAG: methyl-accepting chemotaxis protein [Defluviitaleaceae bacterium]|nr:methyl-accepting chemotaxis protein [Defluviitaleaceae bacterium]